MTSFIRIVATVALALGLCVLLLILACGDKPTEPKPVKDYPVYFVDAQDDGNWFYEYHPATNAIDSFRLPYFTDPIVSADG